MADDRDDRFQESPATRLLDALGRGDVNAALLEFRPTTIVRTEDGSWSLQGEDQVLFGLEDALDLFPGLVFDSHARHIGQGRVIEEARVRDLGDLDAIDAVDGLDGADGPPADGESGAGGEGGAVVLDRDFGRSETPRLNMPLRLTVLHDDQSVHEIILSFPRALLRAAMGEHVDPLDMAVSEIQSAFVAPVGSGFTTYELGTKPVQQLEFPPPAPEPVAAPVAAAEPEAEPVAAAPVLTPAPPRRTSTLVVEDEPRRSRARVIVPLVVLLVAAIAGGAWWLGQGDGGTPEAQGKPGKPGHSQSQKPKPTKKPSASKSPTKSPTATATPTDKPDVVFKSDLAFDKGSAALSDAAKSKLTKLAGAIKAAGLQGTILVDGYTDNLGSEESGLVLSQKRADAVKDYLRAALGGYRIPIQAVGHGEADPIASNDTEAGRQQNRRVTINLPEQ